MKGSMYLLINALIGQIALPLTSASDWSHWSEWSPCSRSCGGGAAYRIRKCLGKTESSCNGDSMVYKTCEHKPCPPGSVDFRAEQCTAYDEVPFRNKDFIWLPYYDNNNRCALRCKAKGYNFVVTLSPKVLDGTKCEETGRDICINGKCELVGCDDELGSTKSLDKCGVCGGDGTSCLPSLSSSGGFEWRLTGYSPCSVTCGVGIHHVTAVCEDSSTRLIVDSENCAHLTQPAAVKQKCIQPRCIVPEWFEGEWQECSKSCNEGVRRRHVYCAEITENGGHRRIPDTHCAQSRPPTTGPCNTERCPTWYAGEWSPCTATCGGGSQYREVICRQMAGHACDEAAKPQAIRKCTATVACKGPTDDRQEMKIAQQNSKHDESNANLKATTSPSFVVSSWSPCSASCGTGVKTRTVTCEVFLTYLDRIETLPDIDCNGKKPVSEKWCYAGSCNSTNNTHDISWNDLPSDHSRDAYSWRYGNFTPCSKSCLRGRQDSMVDCVLNLDGMVVNPKFCSALPGLHTISRVCNDIACPPRWEISGFGRCSVKCGGGISRRPVRCVQQMAPGEENVVMVDESQCTGAKRPETEEPCNEHPCPAKWRTGKWSQCSMPCGGGLQTREVICEKLVLHNNYVIVPEIECPGEEKPVRRRWCVTDCTNRTPKIRTENSTFIQFTSTKKIVLKVGGSALILPGATVVVKCPVRRFNRNLILWYRQGRVVQSKGRVKALKNGALRIRRAKLYSDSGKYMCVASGVNASIEIQFQTRTEAKQKAKVRQKYLDTIAHSREFNKLFKQSLKLSSRIPWKDQPGIVKDESYASSSAQTMFVAGDWSPCSKSCGGEGIQQRKVTCEEMSTGYTRIMSFHKCKKKGLVPPESERKCSSDEKCPQWTSGEWSPCSDEECVKDGYSVQIRDVQCSFQNGSAAKSIFCFPNVRPTHRRECENKDCKSVWETSDWSECIPPCSGAGKKTRMLYCVWGKSGLPAGVNCRKKPRPAVTKPCRTRLCTFGNCLDDSKHCSLVKMLRMCKYNNFKRRCCKTCSDWL
ncbi:ADAMTS-like protein 3 isoform X2 [Liolophura sinensis]|uniref:ADAMTS-like protein 3 isoform X2 n=1 Tax=Liolophura sinensis TaxID=3198878 RepID=UPI0031588218